MDVSKNLLSRSRAKVTSAFRKVSATASHLLHRQNARARTATPRPGVVQDTASIDNSGADAAIPMPEPRTTGPHPTAVQPLRQSILRYVSTNYSDGSSIADVSSTDSGASSPFAPNGNEGGATSGPGLYYREYTVLGERRAADNFALWPIDSPLTAMSQPRLPDAEPATSVVGQSARTLRCRSIHIGSSLRQVSKHESKPSVSDDVNAQIFGPVQTGNDDSDPPATPNPDVASAPKLSFSSAGGRSSASWSHRTPSTPGDSFVVGDSSILPDPFVERPAPARAAGSPQQDAPVVASAKPSPAGRWSDFDSDEFSSMGSKRLVRATSKQWELRHESQRRWSDFESDEFSSSDGKHLVQVGPQQWELQADNRLPEVQQATPSQLQPETIMTELQQPEAFNINDPEGYQPVQPGALAGNWSLPSSMTSEQHLRHTERGLFAAQNALPAIRGLRYAVDRAATDLQALTLENKALERIAAEYQFKTTQVLEPELLRAWEALRERDAEIARLRSIVVSIQGVQALENNTAADANGESHSSNSLLLAPAEFAYQGHHHYHATAAASAANTNLPSSQSSPNHQAVRTPPRQIYGEPQLEYDTTAETESGYTSESETDDMYSS
ncbi:hypothetical protein A1O1_03781 [Capronia coronata CBS 617.96]|uniref:Uncharacterized protein n=1 Tax=Capronia coronata CBS 617.96 TaxID=1182541 RepID=W9YCR7_9EURO|nr:uncharacterized protein A1O1_03781 [Capronia coronata CBS 617.96]EXJ90677.1 hypothetical protein A1O1_03781 [Capronia coronata CBS 617.96]